ncbi:hypothetical protein [Roseovarius indicus]|uniref:hypothetical protein n=1 Tax=Roseovarius indicus TaxID=540747 RepID=UPI0032EF744D
MSTPHSPEIAHALEIATNAHRHEPQARLHAFITLKVARGQSVNSETLPVVHHCPAPAPQKAPDPDMPTTAAEALGQLKPEVRTRVLRRCAQLGIVPRSLRGPEGAA